MKKRLYSVVLLFSFFFCSGGFLVAHADSANVLDWSVNKGDNVKPDDYYSGRSFDLFSIPAFLMLHIRYRKLSISLIRLTLVIPLTKIGSILRGILLRILCVVGFVIMGQMFRSAGLLVLLSVLILRFL